MEALPDSPAHPVQPVLSEVVVRPIRMSERARWDALMRRHHYLGFNRTAGRALRQVAEWRGQWLALLCWQASALMCAPRDRWINWARPIQFQRLPLVVNNSRFLILTPNRVPHLASKVLGLSLRGLPATWQALHGYRPLLAETFVDPEHFAGTCYRAANWQCLGLTRGFARHAGRYHHHGRPKTVWVYPLHRRARDWLRYPLPLPKETAPMHTIDLSDLEMAQLREHLRRLPEPRGGRRQLHPLATVLTIALAATLAGARGYLAISEYAASLTQAQLKRLRAYLWHHPSRPSDAFCSRLTQPTWNRLSRLGSRPAHRAMNRSPLTARRSRGHVATTGRRFICWRPCSTVKARSLLSPRSMRRPMRFRRCANCSIRSPFKTGW